MNTNSHSEPVPAPHPDPALGDLLRTWRVDESVSPAFSRAVWRRIERVPRSSPVSLWRELTAWFEDIVSRPRFATAYLAMLLLAGLAAGLLHGAARSDFDTAGLQGRYIQSIDPLLAEALR